MGYEARAPRVQRRMDNAPVDLKPADLVPVNLKSEQKVTAEVPAAANNGFDATDEAFFAGGEFQSTMNKRRAEEDAFAKREAALKAHNAKYNPEQQQPGA